MYKHGITILNFEIIINLLFKMCLITSIDDNYQLNTIYNIFLHSLKQGALHIYLMYFKINNLIKKQYSFYWLQMTILLKIKKRQVVIIVIILKIK